MAGLLKPKAAYELIGELKSAINLPIHLHTRYKWKWSTYHKEAIDAGVISLIQLLLQ